MYNVLEQTTYILVYCMIFLLCQSFSAWLLLIGRYGNVTFVFSFSVFVGFTSGFEERNKMLHSAA